MMCCESHFLHKSYNNCQCFPIEDDCNFMKNPCVHETEFGVPIAGEILDPGQWARTALKKLPAHGQLDLVALFGRAAPLIVDVGCGNGRFLLGSAVARPTYDHI